MSPVELSCPACKCMLRVPGVKPGSRVRCPRCNEVFAPPASAAPAAPMAEAMAESAPTPAPAPTPVPTSGPVASGTPTSAPAKPAPVAAPTPVATNDDDIFAKIAEADDPVAAVADVRKPKPAAGEPGNPLPLGDDEPPAKTRPTAAGRKAPSGSKGDKGDKGDKSEKPAKSGKKRRVAEWDEDENRTKGAINPVWLLGGLGVLAVGVLAIGLFVLMRGNDKKAEEAAVAEKSEADRRDRELALQREREAGQQKNQQPEPVKADPAQPQDPVENPPLPPRPVDLDKPPIGPAGPPLPPPDPPVRPPIRPGMPPVFPPVDPPVKPNPGAPAEPVKPKPGPGIVRPAANPAKITPTKAADHAFIKLPGRADMTCFGGNGRYVLLRIPSEKQVAVLDVCEGKVTKYIPIPEDSALIAAGNEHLFVLAPTDNVIQRWSLTTFQKERTAANPLEGQVRGLLMGHATDGPVFVVGPGKALDPKTLKQLDLGEGPNAGAFSLGMTGRWNTDNSWTEINISADGRVFAWHTIGSSPSGLSSAVVGERSTKSYYEHTSVGAILPAPDGTLLTAGGLFTPELKPNGEKLQYQYWHHAPIPAAHGRLYITIAPEDILAPPGRRGTQKVELRMIGENKPLIELKGLTDLGIPKEHNQSLAKGLQLHNRVFLVPEAHALVVLHATTSMITIHKVDVDSAMAKAGINFLYVTSRPGGAVCGETFTYKPEVKSRKGGVKVKLDSGPEGMKVAADGTVTWAVPANFADASVSVILTVSDSSGQETFHTFTLPVAARP